MELEVHIPESSVNAVYGINNKNLKLLEDTFGVRVGARGERISVAGPENACRRVQSLLEQISALISSGAALGRGDMKTAARAVRKDENISIRELLVDSRIEINGNRGVTPKSINQNRYINALKRSDMVFGVGPAGTGKTYLAVAVSVSALLSGRVRRIILARPAVEAGERLGFLPGDMIQKVDPYLRPLYDALFDLLGMERTNDFISKGVIEVAPIAFMRGRTLNDSFVILDEAQNTTSEQMKMFLTRIGYNSRAVITGDITQIDLNKSTKSGLVEVRDILAGVEGIEFVYFDRDDVVRHRLVQSIIDAYESHANGNIGFKTGSLKE